MLLSRIADAVSRVETDGGVPLLLVFEAERIALTKHYYTMLSASWWVSQYQRSASPCPIATNDYSMAFIRNQNKRTFNVMATAVSTLQPDIGVEMRA